ncbi:tandem-95 repeat protein [Leptothermofonsia sichuanensis E412]|uniref:cadherin-like domain-containing protein n=1 Tax=Leptothermofonsia sichuanensis TaxID=2917832 RepID=UPI001CA75A4E|nr:cadherin-like domain-containing protein [Leptothermofonsia sichuanensis]QZZ21477.1 tandem-95 repeat protein [Leptothermofonsia sichuanensis E412]
MSDNTLATAQIIRPIASAQTFQEFIGVQNGVLDSSDYYRFTLARSSTVTLLLSGLSADANVEILNTAGAVVTDADGVSLRSTNTGTLPEAFSTVLSAGTYYIHVFPGPATDPLDPLNTTPSTSYLLSVAANDNARSDIFWRNYASGDNGIWFMEGTTLASFTLTTALPSPDWVVQAVGDMDGDGDSDVIFRNRVSGDNAIWIMDGALLVSAVLLPRLADQNWQIGGVGDFNNNGSNDILWRNYATGDNAVWFMNGPAFSGSAVFLDPLPNPNFRIQGTADFNNDGNVDIVFREYVGGGGGNIIWLMNGTTRIQTVVDLPALPDLNFQLFGTGDFNLDGKPDLLFRNVVTGENVVWFLNGTTFAGSAPLTTLGDLNWRPTAPFVRYLPVNRIDLAGNTITSPFAIGTLNGNGRYTDFIGTSPTGNDPQDYYRFFLSSPTTIELSLTGLNGGNLSGDLDVQILNANGVVAIASGVPLESLNPGGSPESITANLNPGTYFIRVFQKAVGENSFYELSFNVNNLPVLATKNNLTLNEGEAQTISSSLLLVTDENNPPNQLTYTLVNPPNRGGLSLGGTAIIAGSTFTQADINANRLSYTHDGSETLVDNFTFNVSDGAGGIIGNTPFTINIIPVNDPPFLVSNQGLTLTEGEGALLTSAILLVTDVEQPPAQVVYSLNSLPTNGSLVLNGTTLTAGSTFTQANLNSGTQLRYNHNGSETTSDSFVFTVTDGAGGFLTPPQTTFSINVIPFNDPPVLTTNLGLTVGQDGTGNIFSTLLSATDAEFLTLPDQIVYTVVTGPTRGTLYRDGTATNTFTQADINNGRVSYDHDGSNTNSDSFTFRITDGVNIVPTASLDPAVFNITINRANFPPVLATNTGLTLSEGTTAEITNTLLQLTDQDNAPPQLVYTLQSLPTNGSLNRFGTAMTIGQTFTQNDLDQVPSRITYRHNGSEILSDSFSFIASDGTTVLAPATFSINVIPVNDAPVLVSNSGATLAEGDSFLITSSVLRITDNDGPPPASLVYSVVSAPANGTLLLATTPVTSFTQADIDSGLLQYSHNGSESVFDSFTFTITDGVIPAPLGPNTFNISITPVNDPPTVSLNTGLTLSEGTSSTIASTALLVTDPDGPNPVRYTLGALPIRGTLLLGSTPLTTGQTFTQAAITSGQLSYQHDGSETTSDRFTFTASDGLLSTTTTTFNINVIPVNDAPVLTLPGAQVVNEDTLLTFGNGTRISVSDPENDNPITVQLSVANGIITVNSGAGVTNNNSNNVTVTGSLAALNTALNNLVYTPNANFNGPDALVVSANDGTDTSQGTINITVAAVNDAPTLTVPGPQIVNEDTPLVLTTIDTTDIDAGGSPVRATLSALNGTLSLASIAGVSFINGANGASSLTIEGTINSIRGVLSNLTYQGNPDYFGTDTITITINDQGATGAPGPQSITRTIPVTVRSVNDAPSFTGGPNQVVNEDSGPQTVAGWATNLSTGPANESNQTLSFIVSNSNPDLFTTAGQPTVNPTTGALTYTPAANAFGTATVTVRLQDSGGTQFGGVDTSSDYTFTITVNPVNDAPSFTPGTNITIAEDSPPQSVLWATNISPGPSTPLPPNESDQTVNFLVSNNNPSLFTITGQPTIAPNGTLSYALAQDANGIAVVTVRLRDSGGTENGGVDTSPFQTFTINVTAVNDAPTLTLPGTQFVDEDTVLGIPGISINDVDAGSGNLRVTLTALGPSGALTGGNLSFSTIPGVAITGNNSNSVTLTGNLTNLNAALSSLNYQGKPNINGEDRIVVTVNDQGNTGAGGALSTTQTLTVNINAVNDAPVLTLVNSTITGAEDTPILLSGISVTDVDAGTSNIQVTVSVLQGTLNATPGTTTVTGAGTSLLTITGAQNAVNAALNTLTYQGNLDYFGPDEAIVTVNDLGNTGIGGALTDTRTLSINVTPVNDPPTFLAFPTGPVPVAEDTNLIFTGGRAIVVTDVDSGPNPVRLTLSVNNGTLTMNTSGLTTIAGANGSQSATYEGTINAITTALASLVYRGNLNYFGPDRLTVSVNDNGFTGAATGIPVIRTLDIDVTPVNDPPVLVTNSPLTLNEGASQVISNGLLRTTDVDNTAAEIVYTIDAAVNNGVLVRSGTTLGVGSTFTQQDVNSNLIRYFHNGSETINDSFTFTVNDGGAQPTTAVFNITVNPINDIPVLAVRQPLTVTEGFAGTISSTLLLVTDPDNTPPQLRYTLINLPSSGAVRLNGSNLSIGQSFTQQDINQNRVTYRHNGSETTTDSFTFTVSDGAGGNIGATAFNISVIPVDDPPIIVSNGPLNTSEGAITTITQSVLQTSDPESQPLTYTLVAQPLFGTLTRGGTVLTNGQTFTQSDINTGLISYQHNGSETPNNRDSFFYTVSDGANSLTRIFEINVAPVNDPPVLLTPNPFIEVPGDVVSVTEISSGVLQVTDVDNTPAQLVYTLVAAPNPTFGQLQLNGVGLITGQTFTQADIDAGRVTYRSTGGGSSDTFQVSISDGGPGGTLPTEFVTIFFTYP